METITLTRFELYQLMRRAAKEGANEAMMQNNLVKNTYTRQEVIKMHGFTVYKKSLDNVRWDKKGNASNSKATCLKTEFDEYIEKFNP